jgi:large subunit ribosomal protein L32
MPNPKHKFSTSRRDKRRTHDKLTAKTIQICQTTDMPHLRHRGYIVDGNLYYKGQLVAEGFEKITKK